MEVEVEEDRSGIWGLRVASPEAVRGRRPLTA